MIILRGLIIGLSTLAVFTSVMYFTYSVDKARTAAFLTLVLTQLIHVFECKSERKSIFEISLFNNKPLVVAVLISLVMILAVIYVPFLQGVFKTVMLTLNEWLLVIGFSFIGPVVASFFRSGKRY